MKYLADTISVRPPTSTNESKDIMREEVNSQEAGNGKSYIQKNSIPAARLSIENGK